MAALLWAAPAVAADVDLGQVPLGASGVTWVTFENDGDDPMIVGAPSVAGADSAAISAQRGPCSDPVTPGALCRIDVTFAPERLGVATATLSVPIEGEPEMEFTVQGEGVPSLRPVLTLVDFGIVPAATESTPVLVAFENVSARNLEGLAALVVPQSTWPPPYPGPYGTGGAGYRVVANGCETVAAGATCHVSVAARPRATSMPGRLTISARDTPLATVDLKSGASRRTRPDPPPPRESPDLSKGLAKGLQTALNGVRKRARRVLLAGGFVVRVPPREDGDVRLVMRSRTGAVVARATRQVFVDGKETLRARLTKRGRRLLRRRKPLVLDVRLEFVASWDKRVSEASGVLRIPKRKR